MGITESVRHDLVLFAEAFGWLTDVDEQLVYAYLSGRQAPVAGGVQQEVATSLAVESVSRAPDSVWQLPIETADEGLSPSERPVRQKTAVEIESSVGDDATDRSSDGYESTAVGESALGSHNSDAQSSLVLRLSENGELAASINERPMRLRHAETVAPLKIGQAFGPRYHILKLLGTGGMGAVYQAWDAELGVTIALKVIRGRASQEAEHRFKRELLLARQVTHKSVVRIHDLGEMSGVRYITMPYIHGDNLGTILRRERSLSISRALHVAKQIAAGLEAAHDAGVVHRDLKPSNIMVEEDHALIMDFGLSASRDEMPTGTVVGTIEYMAPEQSKGESVDGRADIYSFGLILYEMLTGFRNRPLDTTARIAALNKRVAEGLPSIRALDPAFPEALEAVVMRCLQVDPTSRFQTAADLLAALNLLDDAGQPIRTEPGFGGGSR